MIDRQWSADDQQADAPLSHSLLKTDSGKLERSKSRAKSDMVVAEMFQGLDWRMAGSICPWRPVVFARDPAA
eukprot:5401235-Pyramimonas_sp.AAC.1